MGGAAQPCAVTRSVTRGTAAKKKESGACCTAQRCPAPRSIVLRKAWLAAQPRKKNKKKRAPVPHSYAKRDSRHSRKKKMREKAPDAIFKFTWVNALVNECLINKTSIYMCAGYWCQYPCSTKSRWCFLAAAGCLRMPTTRLLWHPCCWDHFTSR